MNYNTGTVEHSLGKKQGRLLVTMAECFGTSFTIEQARAAVPDDDGDLKRRLHDLTAKGWLFSLGRGAYMIPPLDAGPDSARYAVNRYLAAATIVGQRQYFLSHRSAMEIHGMTMHPWRSVYVSTPAKLRSRTIQSFEIRSVTVPEERLWGWTTREVLPESRVNVSDPARTVIDGLNLPAYAGGIGDVYAGLLLLGDSVRPEEIVAAALRFGKVSVIKRAGLLLQTLGVPSATLAPLAERVDRTPHVLDPQQPRSGRLDSDWRIWMNMTTDELRNAGSS
jgi:predicted transcriptional regulator of viral defense system